MQSRVGAISYFFDFEAERFIWAVGDPKDQFLLTKFFDQTARFFPPGLRSFGLIVLEAEKWRSSNQVEIKILLCKSTLQIPKIVLKSMYLSKQRSLFCEVWK